MVTPASRNLDATLGRQRTDGARSADHHGSLSPEQDQCSPGAASQTLSFSRSLVFAADRRRGRMM